MVLAGRSEDIPDAVVTQYRCLPRQYAFRIASFLARLYAQCLADMKAVICFLVWLVASP